MTADPNAVPDADVRLLNEVRLRRRPLSDRLERIAARLDGGTATPTDLAMTAYLLRVEAEIARAEETCGRSEPKGKDHD